MLTIKGKNYPTIQHYIIAKLIASTGTKRVELQNGFLHVKGMGINEAHKLILVDQNLNGSEPQHYKNLQQTGLTYDEFEKSTNHFFTSLLTVRALTKKFEDIELQNLLITTGDRIIEWASPYTRYLNLTNENRGGNYVGVTMMGIREQLKETQKNEEKVFIKDTDINKFVESDALVKNWVVMRVKDMCGTIYKLQQYLKLKDRFDFDLQHDTQLIRLVNFTLDTIYQPCNSLISLAKENFIQVPSFVVDIVAKCSGMSSGEPPLQTIGANGELLYNKKTQEKIDEYKKKINIVKDEFWGGIRIEHTLEESKEFSELERTLFHQFWKEINSSTMSQEEKNNEIKIFKKAQKDDYNEFWGIQTTKKTKDDISKHEHTIKELEKEVSTFIIKLKSREKHYFLIIKEIAQLYWNRLGTMLSVLIQNLPNSATSFNIRDILVKIELLNSEPSNCVRIISNEENNCIVSAILNIMTGILLFKEEFSGIQELETDDVKLAGSIILNTDFQPVNIADEESSDEDSSRPQQPFEIGDGGLFPEDDKPDTFDYEDGVDGDDNYEENPYYGFSKKRSPQGVFSFNKLNDLDIKAIENQLIIMSKQSHNFNDVAIEIMKMVKIIKNSKTPVQKIKQNRINFFATMR